MINKFVTLEKMEELTGYSRRGAEALINKGKWIEGIHYRLRNGRRFVDMTWFDNWVLGIEPTLAEIAESQNNLQAA